MIYVCGDSFACRDPEYGPMWVDLLEQRLGQPVTSLAQVCASNLLISQQVASITRADFVIVLFSASTRGSVKVENSVMPFSWVNISESIQLPRDQMQLLQQWQKVFFDLDQAIFENQCIIEATLQRLVDSGVPFRFDQGGFEHASYGGAGQYFEKYQPWRSDLCLWDWGDRSIKRPSYHIVDPDRHQAIADYYHGVINAST